MNRWIVLPLCLVLSVAPVFAATGASLKETVTPPWVFKPQILSVTNPHTERAADFSAALKQADITGKDIVIFQRGSDWSIEGEALYNQVWNTDTLIRALGDGFILVTIDDPENPDAPPVPQQCDPKHGEVRPFKPFAADRLRDTVQRVNTPKSEVVDVKADSGVPYVRQPDGSFLINTAKSGIPDTDTITVKLKAKPGDSVVRIDFLPHPSLHAGGPGTMHGCISLTGLQVREVDGPIKIRACYSDPGFGSYWELLDENRKMNWGISGGGRQRTLLLALDHPINKETEISVVLRCRDAEKVRLLPGCIGAVTLKDDLLNKDICTLYNYTVLRHRNGAEWPSVSAWLDPVHCPRVAFHDARGLPIGDAFNFKGRVTPDSLAADLKALREKRVARDAKWAEAQYVQGPQRALLLLKGYQQLPFAESWKGKDPNRARQRYYEFLIKEIARIDPKDVAGVNRWFLFKAAYTRPFYDWDHAPPDRDWLNILEGTRGTSKKPTDDDFRAALACIDRELTDPRNTLLQDSQIQILANAKVEVYAKWKKPREQWQCRKQVIAYAPDSYWGLIHTGWLGSRHETEDPFLTYGWGASNPEIGINQVKAGNQVWTIRDTAYRLSHPGAYRLTLSGYRWASSKDPITIRRIALIEQDDPHSVLAEAIPIETENQVGPYGQFVAVDLDCTKWKPDVKYVLQVEYTAAEGHCDSKGEFDLQPLYCDG